MVYLFSMSNRPFLLLFTFALLFLCASSQDARVVKDPFSTASFQVCNQMKTQLGDELVHTPNDTNFREATTEAWNLFNTLSSPTCVILPRTAEQVSTAMQAIYRTGGVRYAVQAGGHSAMRGWDTVEDGVLISFSQMSNVSYDPVKDTIALEPGIRWGEALAQLEPLGVAPLGGRLGDVGTGLLLGGGLSYLSATYGFSVDMLVEADVVLVTGQLVTANATNKYSDLFRALKGGANRFGIVTRYEVRAIHVGRNDDKRMIGGSLLFDNSSSEALLRATSNYVNTVNDPNASILVILGATLDNNEIIPVNIVVFFYNGTALPDSVYGEFLALPALAAGIGSFSYLEANSILGSGGDRGYGQMFGASAFGSAEYDNAAAGLSEEANFARYTNAFSRFQDYLQQVKGSPQSNGTTTTTKPHPPTPTRPPGYPPPGFPIFPTFPPSHTFPSFPPPGSTFPTGTAFPTTFPPRPTLSFPPSPTFTPPAPTFTPPSPTFTPPASSPTPTPSSSPGAGGPAPAPADDPTVDGIASVLLAFTVVQKSQVLAGRAQGRNAMDPPVANYALVQFHTTMPAGLATVSKRVQDARKLFLQKVPPSPGLPLFMNECDADQNVFATYLGYGFLKATYAKYDPLDFNMRFMRGPMGL